MKKLSRAPSPPAGVFLLAVIIVLGIVLSYGGIRLGPNMQPTLWLSFIAGLLSFISPCCLPLYPTYISYISGITFGGDEPRSFDRRVKALSHTFFFVMGFSVIFFALGLSASTLGQIFLRYRNAIQIGGGVIVILMGLSLSGLISPKWLMAEKKWDFRPSTGGYGRSVLVGISFAAGWTPCIGPILASVLVLAANQPASGIALIGAYIAGFAIPFFFLAYTLGSVRWLSRYGAVLSKVGGYLMIILGILLMTNMMGQITVALIRLYGGFTGF